VYSCFFPLFHGILPLCASEFFFLDSSVCVLPFIPDGLPFLTSDSFRRCSSFLGLPLLASDIFRLASSLLGLPLLASDIFCLCSSLNVLPFLASDIFCLDSSRCLNPPLVPPFDKFKSGPVPSIRRPIRSIRSISHRSACFFASFSSTMKRSGSKPSPFNLQSHG